MLVNLILKPETTLEELEEYIERLRENFKALDRDELLSQHETFGPYCVEIYEGVTIELVSNILSRLTLGLDHIRFDPKITPTHVIAILNTLQRPMDVFLSEDTPLDVAVAVAQHMLSGSTLFLSAGLEAQVVKTVMQQLKNGVIICLSRIASIEQAKVIASELPIGRTLKVFSDTSRETLIATAKSLRAGTALQFEGGVCFRYLGDLKEVFAELKSGVALMLTSNIYEDNIIPAVSVLTPGVSVMLASDLKPALIYKVAENISPKTFIRFSKTTPSVVLVNAIKNLNVRAGILLNTRHPADVVQAMVKEMKPLATLYFPFDISADLAEVAAQSVSKGVLIILHPLIKKEIVQKILQSLSSRTIIQLRNDSRTFTMSLIQECPKGIVLNISSELPCDFVMVIVNALKLGETIRLENRQTPEEFLTIANAIPAKTQLILLEEIPKSIKEILLKKRCRIVIEGLDSQDHVKFFDRKRKDRTTKDTGVESKLVKLQ